MRLSTFALAALLPAAAFAAPIKIESGAIVARDYAFPGKNNHPAVYRLRKRENSGGGGNDGKCTPKGHRKWGWKGKHDPASSNYDANADKSRHHGHHGGGKSWHGHKASDYNNNDNKQWEEQQPSASATPSPAPEQPEQSPAAQSETAWIEVPSANADSADDSNGNVGVDLHAEQPESTSSAAPEPTTSAAPEPTTAPEPETSTWVAPQPEPTSEPAPEPTPQPTPEPEQSSNNGGGGNWDFPGGKATFWNTAGEDYWCRTAPGVGSSLTNGDNDMVVAISWELWGGNPGQPQNYDKCGQWVELQWNDRPPVRAQVIDACMSCSADHIDLSKGTFQAVGAGLGLGEIGTHNPSNDYEKPDSFKWRFV